MKTKKYVIPDAFAGEELIQDRLLNSSTTSGLTEELIVKEEIDW